MSETNLARRYPPKAVTCKRMIDLPGPFVDDDGQPKRRVCGAPAVLNRWREIDGARYSEVVCSVCDAFDGAPANKCGDCGQETASDEGLCYECQTRHHGIDFDMDGRGWL